MQTYLAASEEVAQKQISGEYFTPVWSWTLAYKDCKVDKLNDLSKDEEEQEKLWAFSEEAVKTALS